MLVARATVDFLEGYFATNERSSKTKAAYRADLDQYQKYSGERELSEINAEAIEQWATHLRERKYSPASMRRKIVVLKVFFSYWLRKGAIAESPFWRVKLSLGRSVHLPRTLTDAEAQALLGPTRQRRSSVSASDRTDNSSIAVRAGSRGYRAIRNLALLDLLFATGMRVGEASALNLEDVVIAEGVFRIRGKGGKSRLGFAVDAKTLDIQKEHVTVRLGIQTDSAALFLNSSGKRISTQGIANVVARLRELAGIDRHITPHMLRHTVATFLLRNGADVRVVQEFLGHASIVTTQRYTHVTKEHLIGVLRKHHPSLYIASPD
jgi:integrase/recombinase XerD